MLISVIIVVSCFIGVIICILTEKVNRAIAALIGAIITYFVLIFIENLQFSVIVNLLFGSEEEGFVNLHSLILIIAMMIIVIISHEAGVFQFISIKLIKASKGKPIPLLIILCSLTILLSALLNNILTVIILIPLTITISRMLNIDPTPYILTQAILVNIGGTFFLISSIPSILITSYAKISFIEFFLNVGLISLLIFGFTLLFFIFLYKNELKIPKESSKVLDGFNIWNLVQNKRLLYICMISLASILFLFIVIPSNIIPSDMLALSVALILILISKLEPKEIINKIDFELILYLLGIFIIAGALEIIGVTDTLGTVLFSQGEGDVYIQLMLVLWISAFLSSAIDNIPITKVLIPVIGAGADSDVGIINKQAYYTLAIGANWGDNLTPLGDNVLVVNLSEQHKRPVSFKQFFKIGFITTVYQLFIVSIIYALILNPLLGISLLISVLIFIGILYSLYRYGPESIQIKLHGIIEKLRNKIIK